MEGDQEFGHFIAAQEQVYEEAFREITAGRKRSHWMWFIFPQLAGLGLSSMAAKYAIRDLQEASRYLSHPLLGDRLRKITHKLLELQTVSAYEIFGSPDDLKLRSSMTLFAFADGPESEFRQVLKKFYEGRPDPVTVKLLGDLL